VRRLASVRCKERRPDADQGRLG